MSRALIIGVAALALTGVALAANSQTYSDPPGDGSPDITDAQLSNDDNGNFELRVTLADRLDLLDGENLNVFVDTDNSASTGCGAPDIGADYTFADGGRTDPTADHFLLARCLRANRARVCPGSETYCQDIYTPQRTFGGTYDGATRTAIFHFRCAEIGRPAAISIIVTTATSSVPLADYAGWWSYRVSPVCPPDRSKPVIRALRSSGRRGGTAKLSYRVADDSGYTKEAFRVYVRNKLYQHTSSIDVQSSNAGKTYFVAWPVPQRVRLPVRFCTRATDEAGNRSKWSCAAVTIR